MVPELSRVLRGTEPSGTTKTPESAIQSSEQLPAQEAFGILPVKGETA